MSCQRYSIPERFVDVWAFVQSLPKLNVDHPCFHPAHALKDQAEGLIEDALKRASEIAWHVKRLSEIETPVRTEETGP